MSDATAKEVRRFRAIPYFRRGDSLTSIAQRLGVSRQAVFAWREQFLRAGLDGLRRLKRPGRPSVLGVKEHLSILGWVVRIDRLYQERIAGVSATRELGNMISRDLGVHYSRAHLYRILAHVRSMVFYIREDNSGVIIHRRSCRLIRNLKISAEDARHVEWHGPFQSLEEAEDKLMTMDYYDRYRCQCVMDVRTRWFHYLTETGWYLNYLFPGSNKR